MLNGKKALITGSSSGIGLAAARAYLQHGASVVLSSERTLADCPDVADLIRGGRVHYVQADMSKPGESERLVATAWDQLGGLDVLVNNVGTFREPAFVDVSRRTSTSSSGSTSGPPWRQHRSSFAAAERPNAAGGLSLPRRSTHRGPNRPTRFTTPARPRSTP